MASSEDSSDENYIGYAIRRWAIGCPDILPLAENEAKSIKKNVDDIIEIVYIEEKFDIILENFQSLERSMFNISYDSAVSEHMFGDMPSYKRVLQRKVMNLLSSIRMYADHVASHMSSITESAEGKKYFKNLLSNAYDTSQEYRICDALRNFAQHRSFPIQGIQLHYDWLEKDSEGAKFFQTNLSIQLNSKYLIREKDFKRAVAKELEDMPEYIDFKAVIRVYLQKLCSIHESVREYIDPIEQRIEFTLREWENKFLEIEEKRNKKPSDNIGLAVVLSTGQYEHEIICYTGSFPRENLANLKSKRKVIRHIPRIVVTSRPHKARK